MSKDRTPPPPPVNKNDPVVAALLKNQAEHVRMLDSAPAMIPALQAAVYPRLARDNPGLRLEDVVVEWDRRQAFFTVLLFGKPEPLTAEDVAACGGFEITNLLKHDDYST